MTRKDEIDAILYDLKQREMHKENLDDLIKRNPDEFKIAKIIINNLKTERPDIYFKIHTDYCLHGTDSRDDCVDVLLNIDYIKSIFDEQIITADCIEWLIHMIWYLY